MWLPHILFIHKGLFIMDQLFLEKVDQALSVLTNVYDVVRIVDPVSNTVVYNPDREMPSLEKIPCYRVWNKNRFCDNCISLRVQQEQTTLFKFEMIDTQVFLVTASVFSWQDTSYVLEMLTDITHKSLWTTLMEHKEENFADAILRFNDSVVKDELTGVFNRRFINERLPVQLFHHALSGTAAYLLMVDIDFFKHINDVYGHRAGDAVLQQFAGLLQAAVPNSSSWAARYGGDEFLLYLEDVSRAEAEMITRTVHDSSAAFSFTIPEGTIRTSCSIGFCALQTDMEMQEWLERVDRNLYRAKQKGRNSICGL
jgi:diguanylate cyclase (GGDEF)-like protein